MGLTPRMMACQQLREFSELLPLQQALFNRYPEVTLLVLLGLFSRVDSHNLSSFDCPVIQLPSPVQLRGC